MNREAESVINQLKGLANNQNRSGMGRFGINTCSALGISIKTLRQIARKHRKNHPLALELWESGIHEARILAVLIEDPKQLGEKQMDQWVEEIDSWDLCDQACNNLFDKWPGAYSKAREWSHRKEEFVKRAGFVLMVSLAVHDKQAPDEKLAVFFADIHREACDPRNFVKKAVNWALRALGKRSKNLHQKASALSRELANSDHKTARWIGSHALRELESEKVRQQLAGK